MRPGYQPATEWNTALAHLDTYHFYHLAAQSGKINDAFVSAALWRVEKGRGREGVGVNGGGVLISLPQQAQATHTADPLPYTDVMVDSLSPCRACPSPCTGPSPVQRPGSHPKVSIRLDWTYMGPVHSAGQSPKSVKEETKGVRQRYTMYKLAHLGSGPSDQTS